MGLVRRFFFTQKGVTSVALNARVRIANQITIAEQLGEYINIDFLEAF